MFEFRRIRSMDLTVIRRVAEYCMDKKIVFEFHEDDHSPSCIFFYSSDLDYRRILFYNGLNDDPL